MDLIIWVWDGKKQLGRAGAELDERFHSMGCHYRRAIV